jgi:hypothetical protein
MDIEGSVKYKKQVTNCLDLLARKAPKELAFVKNHIGKISQNEKSGMRAWEDPPLFQMSDTIAFHSLTWCSGSIAHDAYHSYLYMKHSPEGGGTPPYEKWAGFTAEKQSIDFQISVMKKIGASDNEVKYLESLDGKHGDVNRDGKLDSEDYKLRDW